MELARLWPTFPRALRSIEAISSQPVRRPASAMRGRRRGCFTPAMSLKSRSRGLEFSPTTSSTTRIVDSPLTQPAPHSTHYRLAQIRAHSRANLPRPGERPDEEIDDVSPPVFAFSVLDFCGAN